MPTINTNMSLFDSPPSAKAKAPPTALDDEEDPHGNYELTSSYMEYEDLDGENSSQHKQDSSYQDTEGDDAEFVDYNGILKQATVWKATMQGVLDTVYKLRIEAAITLDTFAMMDPESNLGQDEEDGKDKSGDMASPESRSHDIEMS